MVNFTYENKKGFSGFSIKQYKNHLTLKMCKDCMDKFTDRDNILDVLENELFNINMYLIYSGYDGYWHVYDSQDRWYDFPQFSSMSLEMEREIIPALMDSKLIRLNRTSRDMEIELNEFHNEENEIKNPYAYTNFEIRKCKRHILIKPIIDNNQAIKGRSDLYNTLGEAIYNLDLILKVSNIDYKYYIVDIDDCYYDIDTKKLLYGYTIKCKKVEKSRQKELKLNW